MKLINAIAERLKTIIQQKGITKNEIARKGNFSVSTLTNVINGKTKKITTRTVQNIIKGLDMTYKEFFDDNIFDWENLDKEL